MHPHLKALRDQYEQLQASITAIQTRAVDQKRDLDEVELRTIQEQTELAKTKFTQIEQLTEHEVRSSKVQQMAALVNAATAAGGDNDGDGDGAEGGELEIGGMKFRRVGGARTQDRDPGHYRSSKDGGKLSFFGDMCRARLDGDEDAGKRQQEHFRALATGGAGAGIFAPKWLIDEYAPLARMGRNLANAVRGVNIGQDPRVMTLPKQSTGADAANPATQAAENDVTPSADKFAATVDTVSPKPVRGKQIVSRQMMDASTPAADLVIYGDLIAEYNRQTELNVGAALVTASGAAVATFATEAAFVGVLPAVPASDAVVDTAIAVWNARKLPANALVMGATRWGRFKKLRDNNGRKLIPDSSGGTVNVEGVGDVTFAGEMEGLGIIITESTNINAYPDNVLAVRLSDTILFEGDLFQFRFEEKSGPESIELGIWCYQAVLVRYAGSSSKRFTITAA